MQTYWDLDWQKRAELSSSDLDRYIAIECAEKGAMLLPPEPEQPTKQIYEKDATIYRIGSYYVGSTEEALQLATALSQAKLLDVEEGYYTSSNTRIKGYVQNSWEQDIKPLQAFSQEKWRDIEAEKIKYDRLQSEYEKATKEYQGIRDNRNKTTRELNDDYEYQRHVLKWYQKLLTDFETYRNLAGGDESIARRFMSNAIKTTQVDDYEVFNFAVKNAGFEDCLTNSPIEEAA